MSRRTASSPSNRSRLLLTKCLPMANLSPDNRPVVLIFASFYLPGYKGGGPIKTLKNLILHAGNEITFRLVSRDRDLGDKYPYSTVTSGEWNNVGDALVFYVYSGALGYKQISSFIRSYDYSIIYLNSFFSVKFSIFPLLLACALQKKVVLAPRGEFSSSALNLKALKKKVYIRLFKLLQLEKKLVFQASSKLEAEDIRRTLNQNVDVYVAENIGSKEFGGLSHKRQAGVLRAVVVSRISPMKNLLMALESLRNISNPFLYHIFGPVEDESYWKQCLKVIETLPAHVEVVYKGPLHSADVAKTIISYDVFYLPTKGENYGHAIAEAICAGLPVVISNKTPWQNLKEHGIGWDLPLGNVEDFRSVLDQLASMPEEEYINLRHRVLAWAKKKFSSRDAIDANIAMFRYAYNKR